MPKKVVTQISPRTLASRINGAKGGKARAKNKTKAQIQAWGAKGGNQTLALYGSDFFADAQSRRKTVGQFKTPK